MKDLKIFTSNIEKEAENQINLLLEQDAFKDCKVRIMPDVHAGAGCVIGFTADLGDKVIPNVVGVDIGCGMAWVETTLKETDVDLKKIDQFIRNNIPSGMSVRGFELDSPINIEDLFCYNELKNKERYLQRSMGTLGGGNHFIEIDKKQNGSLVFIVHSGSRNLGKQVCEIYQEKAIKNCSYETERKIETEQVIKQLKEEGKQNLIQDALKEIKYKYQNKTKLPKDLCYIEGKDREDYLHDMRICQKWAMVNRNKILGQIIMGLGFLHQSQNINHTIHNYISDDNLVRKGAISAQDGETVLIPINMRDGCIIAKGKGNKDWNCSAPHGAGRIMSRNEARNKLRMADFQESMKNIYTTSICKETLDESPMAYKPIDEIINNIGDTVEIIEIIKPIYNFKAKE